MKLVRKTSQKQRTALKRRVIILGASIIILTIGVTFLLNFSFNQETVAANFESPSFPEGSVILNLGDDKTAAQAAMVIWEMIKNQSTPIAWLPEQSDDKTKTIDNISYSKGALIIDERLMTLALKEKMKQFQEAGLSVNYAIKKISSAGTILLQAIPEFSVDTTTSDWNQGESILIRSNPSRKAYHLNKIGDSKNTYNLSLKAPYKGNSNPLLYSFIDGCLKNQLCLSINCPKEIRAGTKTILKLETGNKLNNFTCQWNSSNGGIFEEQDGMNGTCFIAPKSISQATSNIISCLVKSSDGKEALIAMPVTILPAAQPVDSACEKLIINQPIFENSLSFKIRNQSSGTGELRLYNTDGLLVDKIFYTLESGMQTIRYTNKQLKNGSYIAVFQSGRGSLYATSVIKI